MSVTFDTFTEQARRALQLAQEEVQRLNQSFIGTEHILRGLLSEGEGIAHRAQETSGGGSNSGRV